MKTTTLKVHREKGNKYTYYKTIQQNWGHGWDSVDHYECDSTGYMTAETRKLFNENYHAYRENQNAPLRTVITKELNKDTVTIKITQDGELKAEFTQQKGDSKAFGWLLRNQGQSIDYALRFGGWKVEVINEQTQQSEFWKPYSK